MNEVQKYRHYMGVELSGLTLWDFSLPKPCTITPERLDIVQNLTLVYSKAKAEEKVAFLFETF